MSAPTWEDRQRAIGDCERLRAEPGRGDCASRGLSRAEWCRPCRKHRDLIEGLWSGSAGDDAERAVEDRSER